MATTSSPQPAGARKTSWLANQPLQRKMMLGVGLLLGMFLVANLVVLNAMQREKSNRQSAGHTYQVLLQIGKLQRAVRIAQVSLDGFMLSQSTGDLGQFRQAVANFDHEATRLRGMTADRPLQQTRLDTAMAIASRWQREAIDLAITPGTKLSPTDPAVSAAREEIRHNYHTRRSVTVEELTAVLDRMAASENQLLPVYERQFERRVTRTRTVIAITITLGLLIGIMVVRLTSQMLIRPLRRLTDQMTRLSRHDHDFEIYRLNRRDEVGEIARALQVFRQMSLDNEAQTWIRSRTSEISHTLLQATTHKDFAQWLINAIVPLCNAGLGLFYSFDDARHRLDLLGSYGLRLNHRSSDHYLPGEGLVGQCASERKPIILDNVPPNYPHIDSGTGAASPNHIVILPVLYRDTLIGVLELASFRPLTALQRGLLDELLPIVALTLENLNQAVHTQGLLLQTQEQADELRLSELVMRQQKIVLRESNDTLQAKTQELEEQSRRLMASDEVLRVQAEELRASNEELREMTENLNRQKYVLEDLQQETADKAAELAQASQYKSEFLANMSHELRTPLNSLLILSRSLAENDTGNLDAEQVEAARIIHDAGNNLLELINDILDLSKVEAGKMDVVLDDLQIADLGRRLERTFSHVAAAKGVGFSIVIDPGLPATLRTDDGKLEQIANNLLSNAFKFTAKGAVDVHIGRPSDDLEIPDILRGQPLVAVTVSDTGIGIPEDRQEAVFNAFEQVDAGTSRQFGGTGLGLALSLRMANLLGGDIVLRSEHGQGSRFTLLLPETPQVREDIERESSNDDATRRSRTAPSRALPASGYDDRASLEPGQTVILVIEDDAAFVKILVDLIHRKGYRVLAALDGESGLELARRFRPTGILLDVGLPTIDGWTVLDRLKADDATRAIPVHVVSVNDDSARSTQDGAIGFLTKPVSREAIAAAIDRLLQFSAGTSRRQLVDDDAGSRTMLQADSDNVPNRELTGHHVLLVDDDMRNLFALSKVLRGWGMRVSQAQDGHKALKMLAGEDQPDLILMDIMMPGMDGYATMQSIREQPALASIPIIALTAKAMPGDREKCLQMGAGDYLSKPIDIDKLAAMLARWLQNTT